MALRISDLGTAPTVEETDLVEIAEVDGESPSGYSSYKTTILGIANKVATSTVFSGLETTTKNLVGAINEVDGLLALKESKADMEDDVTDILKDLSDDVTVTGNPVTFETINGGMAKSCEVTFSPIQSGSGDPSPENVRPISGWDSLVLGQDNIYFDKTQKDETKGYVNNRYISDTGTLLQPSSDNWYVSEYYEVKPSTTYTVKGLATSGSNAQCVGLYSESKTFISSVQYRNSASVTFTTTSTTKYIRLSIGPLATTESNIVIESPQHTTHTATFPDTVYGGKLDYTTGKVNVTHKIVDLGTLNWTFDANNHRFQSVDLTATAKGNATTVMPNMLCECYPVFKASDTATTTLGITKFTSGQYVYVRVIDANYSSLEDFVSAVTGQHLCYELATTTPFSTTPTNISLNKGDNVISTDANELKLVASKLANVPDLLTYIQSLEARIKALEEA